MTHNREKKIIKNNFWAITCARNHNGTKKQCNLGSKWLFFFFTSISQRTLDYVTKTMRVEKYTENPCTRILPPTPEIIFFSSLFVLPRALHDSWKGSKTPEVVSCTLGSPGGAGKVFSFACRRPLFVFFFFFSIAAPHLTWRLFEWTAVNSGYPN